MKSTETLLKQLDNPALEYDQQVRLRCELAADLEHRGQYEAASEALAELWQGVGQRPKLERVSTLTAAEILLRAGSLSGWLGSIRQIEGAQAAAKDLISESIARFQALSENIKVAAAQGELGLCYKRTGAYDNARVVYKEALNHLTDTDEELKTKILLRLVVVELTDGRYNDALRILTKATSFFEASVNHALKGKFHNELCYVLTVLGKVEFRSDYIDRAIIECTAAAYHFEQAGHTHYYARTENNLGFLLYTVGRYVEAHENLNHARRLFTGLKDYNGMVQVDETRARVLLAEGEAREAAKVIGAVVRALSKGDEQGLLAEALTTQGRVLARLRDMVGSENKLRQAAAVAEQAGVVEDAGRALLCLMEEHWERLGEQELLEVYERADGLLGKTQDAETVGGLRACAGRIVSMRRAAERAAKARRRSGDFWAGFSLTERVRVYEARYIKRALIEARGSVSRAARLLGLKHHASLASLLKGRHRELVQLRTPPEKRSVHVVRLRGPRTTAKALADEDDRTVRILHVEDNQLVADGVRVALEAEGWEVETVAEGAEALRLLAGDVAYDLLLFDNELPGLSGVELVRAARRLEHRRHTPIVMLSAGDIRVEAERAGVDAFLRKPDEVMGLVEIVTRLLGARAS